MPLKNKNKSLVSSASYGIIVRWGSSYIFFCDMLNLDFLCLCRQKKKDKKKAWCLMVVLFDGVALSVFSDVLNNTAVLSVQTKPA